MDKNKSNVRLIMGLVAAIIIALFAVLNSKEVEISFGFTSIKISQAIVILVSMTLGAVLMYSMSLLADMKRKKKQKEDAKSEQKKDANKTVKTEDVKQSLYVEPPSETVENSIEDVSKSKNNDEV